MAETMIKAPVGYDNRLGHRCHAKGFSRWPVQRPSIGAELAPRQVIARIDRSLFLYPVGGRYDMLEWL